MKLKQIYIMTILCICAATATGQSQSSVSQAKDSVAERSFYDMTSLKQYLPWFKSSNPAGLRLVHFDDTSIAELFYQKQNGEFVKTYESDNNYTYGLRTESFRKIKRTVFYGKVEYSNFIGQNMSMSGVIHPDRYPLYVGDTNPGEKRLETYTLVGAVGMPLCEGLDFGFRINYEAANMAKRKDLRHKNNMMDMEVTPSLMYKIGWVRFGVNYYYRKFHDKPSFSRVSDNALDSKGYLFKGLGFGMFEMWTTPGINLSRSFSDAVNGVGVQIEFTWQNLTFFNQFNYSSRSGITGEGKERAYSKLDSENFGYNGVVTMTSGRNVQYLRVSTEYDDCQNNDRITNRESIGGISTSINYGTNKIFTQRTFRMNAEYEFAAGMKGFMPTWSALLGADFYSHAAVSSLLAPLYHTQEVDYGAVYAKVCRRIFWKKSVLDLNIEGRYRSGGGSKLEEHSSSTGNVIVQGNYPILVTEVLDRDFEYLTAKRATAAIEARYAINLNPKKGNSLFVRARYAYSIARGVVYTPGNRNGVFDCSLGYSF